MAKIVKTLKEVYYRNMYLQDLGIGLNHCSQGLELKEIAGDKDQTSKAFTRQRH